MILATEITSHNDHTTNSKAFVKQFRGFSGLGSTRWTTKVSLTQILEGNVTKQIPHESCTDSVQSSISGQLLLCTEKGFQGGLVFKARRLL